MKIFYMGKRIRDSEGRFSSFKKNIIKFLRWTLKIGIASFIGTALAVGLVVYNQMQNPIVVQAVKEVPVDNLSVRIEELKEVLLDKLEKCEAGGFSEADAPIVFDSNNQASLGMFQFQKRTVVHYFKVLYGEEITQKQAVEIAIDSAKSRKLAKEIIFNSKSELKDWTLCTKKLALDKELQFIKSL